MESQVTNNANALRLFFTEDVFLVEDKSVNIASVAPASNILPGLSDEAAEIKTVLSADKVEEVVHENALPKLENSIKEAEMHAITNEPVLPKTFRFLGGNKKAVLILVNDTANDVSSEQGRELLRKIVKAIDLATPDFALLNYANYHNVDFVELHQFFKPAVMLAFGVEAEHLKLNLSWTGEIIFHGTTKMIFAPNLHALDGDLSAKKSLWGNLQKLK